MQYILYESEYLYMKTKILIGLIVGVLLLGGGFGYQYHAAQAKKQALIAEEQAKQKKEAEEKKAKEERFKNMKKE